MKLIFLLSSLAFAGATTDGERSLRGAASVDVTSSQQHRSLYLDPGAADCNPHESGDGTVVCTFRSQHSVADANYNYNTQTHLSCVTDSNLGYQYCANIGLNFQPDPNGSMPAPPGVVGPDVGAGFPLPGVESGPSDDGPDELDPVPSFDGSPSADGPDELNPVPPLDGPPSADDPDELDPVPSFDGPPMADGPDELNPVPPLDGPPSADDPDEFDLVPPFDGPPMADGPGNVVGPSPGIAVPNAGAGTLPAGAEVGCPTIRPAAGTHCTGWIPSGDSEASCQYGAMQCNCAGQDGFSNTFGWQCRVLSAGELGNVNLAPVTYASDLP